jgi:hypothetical protein
MRRRFPFATKVGRIIAIVAVFKTAIQIAPYAFAATTNISTTLPCLASTTLAVASILANANLVGHRAHSNRFFTIQQSLVRGTLYRYSNLASLAIASPPKKSGRETIRAQLAGSSEHQSSRGD